MSEEILKNEQEQVLVEGEEITAEPEQATEQIEETYTKADLDRLLNEKLDQIIPKKLARKEAKLRREYDVKMNKYLETENVLKHGMGVESIEEATESLREFYTNKGAEIPKFERQYNENDLNILARVEAESMIADGFDEVVEEVDRLASKGYENLTPIEKKIFTNLAEFRKAEEGKQELMKLGIKPDLLADSEFQDFKKMFNGNVELPKIVEMFNKQNKKKPEQIGSMTTTPNKTIKDFYTPEEVRKLNSKDLDDPSVMKAVRASMAKWNK